MISIETIPEFSLVIERLKEKGIEIGDSEKPDLKIFLDWCYGDPGMRITFASRNRQYLRSFQESSYSSELYAEIFTINYSFLAEPDYPCVALELFEPGDIESIEKNLDKIINLITGALYDYNKKEN